MFYNHIQAQFINSNHYSVNREHILSTEDTFYHIQAQFLNSNHLSDFVY